jgi:probable phosphoglycerate mutase
MFQQERWDVIPGGETFDSLGRRVRAGIEKIVELTGPDAVAVAILHGGVIGEVCRQATDSRPFAFVHSDNGSVSRLVIRPSGRWLLRSFNEVSHLTIRTGPSG